MPSSVVKAISFFFVVSAAAACGTNSNGGNNSTATERTLSAPVHEPVPDSVVQFLITSAAGDFHRHQPPAPIDFRRMGIGYLLSPSNGKQFVLCGEYLTEEGKANDAWETFATIQTSGYEHYLGGHKPVSYCRDATMVLVDEAALALRLKSELETLRNSPN